MGRAERIVFAFGALGETIQPAPLAQGLDAITPPSQDFMGIGLMAHIPDQAVARRIEDMVERHRKLNNAETRPKVATGDRDRPDGLRPELIGKLLQILGGERTDARRVFDLIQ